MAVFLESWEQCEKTADIPKSPEQYKQEIVSDFLTETSSEIHQFCHCFSRGWIAPSVACLFQDDWIIYFVERSTID